MQDERKRQDGLVRCEPPTDAGPLAVIDAACAQLVLQQLESGLFGIAARCRRVVLTGFGEHALFVGPFVGIRVCRRFGRRGWRRNHPSRGTLDGTRRRDGRFGGRTRGAGFTPHPPVHAQSIFEGFGDDVGVALFAHPLGQRRRFVTQHQGVAFDRAHGGTGQHHFGGTTAFADLVAHRRPQRADGGRVRLGRACNDRNLFGHGGLGIGWARLPRRLGDRRGRRCGRRFGCRSSWRRRRGFRTPDRRGPLWLLILPDGQFYSGFHSFYTIEY